MRDGFLLDPEVGYFNHGGYGACPVGSSPSTSACSVS